MNRSELKTERLVLGITLGMTELKPAGRLGVAVLPVPLRENWARSIPASRESARPRRSMLKIRTGKPR